MKAYVVEITEHFTKRIVVYSEDKAGAEERAEALANEERINFDLDKISEYSRESCALGEASVSDLNEYDVYEEV